MNFSVKRIVYIQRAAADFREASERRLATSSQTNSVNKHFATRYNRAEETQYLLTGILGPDV